MGLRKPRSPSRERSEETFAKLGIGCVLMSDTGSSLDPGQLPDGIRLHMPSLQRQRDLDFYHCRMAAGGPCSAVVTFSTPLCYCSYGIYRIVAFRYDAFVVLLNAWDCILRFGRALHALLVVILVLYVLITEAESSKS